jgi:hypothetical protein
MKIDKYFNPKNPGSFSGLNSFYKNSNIKKQLRKTIKNSLLQNDTYTLHKPVTKKFTRNRVIVAGKDNTWQIDLVDVSKISKENDNFKFLLVCIDVFSKYAWVIPLINKKGKSVLIALEKIFKERQPIKIQADQGKEFFNRDCESLFKKLNIKLYYLNSEMKASIVERFNRTLKEKLWRYFTFKSNYRYIDILDDIVKSYNNSYHSTIKTSPSKVNSKNEKQIWQNIYGYKSIEELYNDTFINFKFKVGDKVRISKNKNIFGKGYTPNWSYEIFTINETLPRVPPVYTIKDYNNELINGVFYENELQEVYKLDNVYKVETILNQKKSKGKIHYFVKWYGYPDNFNSWIPATDLIT